MRLPSLDGASFAPIEFMCALRQGMPSRHGQAADTSPSGAMAPRAASA